MDKIDLSKIKGSWDYDEGTVKNGGGDVIAKLIRVLAIKINEIVDWINTHP